MSIGKRIKDRRKQLKLSVEDMAKKLGKNRATIYRYESSEIENMPLDILEPLAKALKVTPAYLMGWESEKDLPTLSSDYPYLPHPVAAGLPENVDGITGDQIEKISIPDSIMGKWAGTDNIFIMRTNGQSMNKVIPDQSLIAVKPTDVKNLKDNDIVVFSNDNEYSVKRFYNDKENKRFIFSPESNDKRFIGYPVPYDQAGNLKIHGKVVVYIVELD